MNSTMNNVSEITETETPSISSLLVTWHGKHNLKYLSVITLIAAVLLLRVINYVIKNIFTSLFPESLVAIFIGTVIGSLMRTANLDWLSLWDFTPQLFFMAILPFCVIDAAYTLYNRAFADCVVAIISYAVFATVLNVILIGLILIFFERVGLFASEGLTFGPQVLIFFSTIIAAVDPVAVLNVFYEIGVHPNLYYLVLGESLLNDAVIVVLYKIVYRFLQKDGVTVEDVFTGILAFFTSNAGGILVGLAFGAVSCILTRMPTRLEVVFLFVADYAAYLLSDCLGWSGLVAIITSGMIQSSYAFNNLTSEAAETCRRTAHMLADICETLTFLLIGVAVTFKKLRWHSSFILMQFIACLLVRTVVVFGMTWCLNKYDMNYSRITVTEQFILAYGGLRGAVALALAYLADPVHIDRGQKGVHETLITATLFTILFTVGIMGPTMKPLVRLLRVKLVARKEVSLMKELNERLIDEMDSGMEIITGHMGRNRYRDWFDKFNDKYVRKILQNEPEYRNERIIKTYQEMALILHKASLDPKRAEELLEQVPVSVRTTYMAQDMADKAEDFHRLQRARTRYPERNLHDIRSLTAEKLQQFWDYATPNAKEYPTPRPSLTTTYESARTSSSFEPESGGLWPWLRNLFGHASPTQETKAKNLKKSESQDENPATLPSQSSRKSSPNATRSTESVFFRSVHKLD